MPNYEGSKGIGHSVEGDPVVLYPDGATNSPWGRLAPLLTPDDLRIKFLFGIPLVSRIKDPVTGRAMVMTNDIIKEYIIQAVNQAEILLDLVLFPTKFVESKPMDPQEYRSFGYMQLDHKPIYSMDSLTVRMSDQIDLFQVPMTWIETSNLIVGQLNLIPLTLAIASPYGLSGSYGGQGIANPMGAGGAIFLNIFSQSTWVPSFWCAEYTAGFPNGVLPTTINDVVGLIASINILSALGATYARVTGASLGVDGLSQSVSGPGPNLFVIRIGDLEKQLKMLVGRFRAKYGSKIIVGNV